MGQAAPELTEAEVAQICRLATGVSGMVGEWSLQVCDGLMDRNLHYIGSLINPHVYIYIYTFIYIHTHGFKMV